MPTNGWGNIYCNSFSGDTALASGGGGGFDPDYQAVLDYATTQGYTLPSAGQQTLQNQLVLDLKAAGYYSLIDSMRIYIVDGDSNFALVDWVRLVTMTAVNAPAFTVNGGFTGNGTSAYINTGFIQSTATNQTLNSAAIIILADDYSSNVMSAVRSQSSPSNWTGNFVASQGFVNGNPDVVPTNMTANQIQIFSRLNNDVNWYEDGVLRNTSVGAPTSINTIAHYDLCANIGAPIFFSTGQVKIVIQGADVSPYAAAVTTALNNYIAAI